MTASRETAVTATPPPAADLDSTVEVSQSDASASEAAEGLRFVVALSQRIRRPSPSATAGSAERPLRQDFTLAAGATSLDIVVPVIDDNTVEGDETLTVYVYATSGITIPGYFVYADGTITDDD